MNDFVVAGDARTIADLLTGEGLDFVKSYADYYDLGVDGLFTDFADTGVEAREASITHFQI